MNRKLILSISLVLIAGSSGLEAQMSARTPTRLPNDRPSGVSTTTRTDRDRDRDDNRGDRDRDRDRADRTSAWCADAFRDYARDRSELQQRLRRQHADWHRAHDRARDYVRQHNQLHDRLERTRENWERAHDNRLERCENRRGDWDDRGQWNQDDRWDERERLHDRTRDRRR